MAWFGKTQIEALRREQSEIGQQLRSATDALAALNETIRGGLGDIKSALGAEAKRLAEIGEQQTDILNEIVRLRLSMDFDRLGEDKVLRFDYHGSPIRLFLPVGPTDLIQSAIMRRRSFYGVDALERLREFMPMAGERVLDVGANIGNHTVFFARICSAREVECFEPGPLAFEALRRNVELNGVSAVLHNVALGAFAREAELVVVPQNLGASHIVLEPKGGVNVKLFALDELDIAPFRAIKIDVEGRAAEVLLGARRTIDANRPSIAIEALPDEFERVDQILRDMNYRKADRWARDYIYLPA